MSGTKASLSPSVALCRPLSPSVALCRPLSSSPLHFDDHIASRSHRVLPWPSEVAFFFCCLPSPVDLSVRPCPLLFAVAAVPSAAAATGLSRGSGGVSHSQYRSFPFSVLVLLSSPAAPSSQPGLTTSRLQTLCSSYHISHTAPTSRHSLNRYSASTDEPILNGNQHLFPLDDLLQQFLPPPFFIFLFFCCSVLRPSSNVSSPPVLFVAELLSDNGRGRTAATPLQPLDHPPSPLSLFLPPPFFFLTNPLSPSPRHHDAASTTSG